MKPLKVVFLGTAIALALTSTGFAADMNQKQPLQSVKSDSAAKKHEIVFEKEPIKRLEGMKSNIQKKVARGEITQDKADKITARIDKKISEINEFNKLPLNQKKATLITNYKTMMGKRVQNGKLAQSEADKLIAEFTTKINAWDGNGYPMFKGGAHKGNFKHHLQDKTAK